MTNTERFLEAQRLTWPKKPKQTHKPARSSALTNTPNVHNKSARAAKNATYAYEVSNTKPSRKSTRKSKNRQKTDAAMTIRLSH